MPPEPLEYQGHAAITEFFRTRTWLGTRTARLVPTRANNQPAFGYYLAEPHAPVAHAHSLIVLTLAGDEICCSRAWRADRQPNPWPGPRRSGTAVGGNFATAGPGVRRSSRPAGRRAAAATRRLWPREVRAGHSHRWLTGASPPRSPRKARTHAIAGRVCSIPLTQPWPVLLTNRWRMNLRQDSRTPGCRVRAACSRLKDGKMGTYSISVVCHGIQGFVRPLVVSIFACFLSEPYCRGPWPFDIVVPQNETAGKWMPWPRDSIARCV